MRTKGSIWIAVFFLIIGLYGLIQSLMFGYWEAVALPAAVSGVVVLMATVEVGKELYSPGKEETTSDTLRLRRDKREEIDIRRLGIIVGWIAAFMLCIYLFGFRISVPLFAFLYLKWRGRHWLIAAVFALVMLAFIYGAFELSLKVSLFQGIFFGAR